MAPVTTDVALPKTTPAVGRRWIAPGGLRSSTGAPVGLQPALLRLGVPRPQPSAPEGRPVGRGPGGGAAVPVGASGRPPGGGGVKALEEEVVLPVGAQGQEAGVGVRGVEPEAPFTERVLFVAPAAPTAGTSPAARRVEGCCQRRPRGKPWRPGRHLGPSRAPEPANRTLAT